MIGILIVTHGNLGKEFVSAAEHVLGKQEKIESIAFSQNMIWIKKEKI
jgi:PTS system mannose-specific IIA component